MEIFVNELICHQFVTPNHYAVLQTDNEKLVCYVLDNKLVIPLECFIVSSQFFHTRYSHSVLHCSYKTKIGQCAQMYGFPK